MRKLLLMSCLGLIAALTGPALVAQEKVERVGKDTCLSCHEVSAGFASSPHAVAECEDCHGPGQKHVDEGGDPEFIRSASAAGWTEACQSCHARQGTDVAEFSWGPHGSRDIGCRDCHRIHPEEGNFGLLARRSELELCSECHRGEAAQFRLPFHHPVREGMMECSDCHSPHAPEQSQRRLEPVSGRGCVSCHSDKKGPFAFPHSVVEAGECTTCHVPHGGINPRLLVRTQVHQLCLECHSPAVGVAFRQPPSFHDLRSPRYRNCTTCHREIHGSNVDPNFVR
ncbi:MAG: DmsE family decaheme c-type cytochrome [Acidobacteriota bacterium]